ncbi:MAG: hypothetical protein NTU49_03735 [Gammaproteobacteria bacterium]|nr:hypothetical protein [Gammaproteobacteria bacterium]
MATLLQYTFDTSEINSATQIFTPLSLDEAQLTDDCFDEDNSNNIHSV